MVEYSSDKAVTQVRFLMEGPFFSTHLNTLVSFEICHNIMSAKVF